MSLRNDKPFVKVNCGAIPESLIDSELFGHQKGAFTGAISNKTGRFEQANGGTLFLDEVGELPLHAQVRLLRVLQSSSFERVGGEKTIRVDVRIIAATNRPLESMMQTGEFREDLYYRLNVFPIHVPPLRERPEDIPLLIRHFIRQQSKQLKLAHILPISATSIEQLHNYYWPGNVRELKNLVERAITVDPEHELDLTRYLPEIKKVSPPPTEQQNGNSTELIRQQIREVLSEFSLGELLTSTDSAPKPKLETSASDNSQSPQTLDEAMEAHISKVLKECHGKISGPGGAAEKLDINPNTLRKRMEKLNMSFGSY